MSVKKIKLSIKEHNKLFKYRQVKWMTYYEIIDDIDKRELEMIQYIRLPARMLWLVLSPLVIFVGGVPAFIKFVKELLTKTQVGADKIDRDWFYTQMKELRGAK